MSVKIRTPRPDRRCNGCGERGATIELEVGPTNNVTTTGLCNPCAEGLALSLSTVARLGV